MPEFDIGKGLNNQIIHLYLFGTVFPNFGDYLSSFIYILFTYDFILECFL